MRIFYAGAALLALAACDGGGGEPTKMRSVQASNPYVEQLKGLNELNRGLALRRAIQDSGSYCKKVESSGFQENYKNMSMWTARCADGRGWAIFIAPNGDVQVRKCTDAATLELPACRLESA